MTSKFIGPRCWDEITTAARATNEPAVAAVAYFGENGAKLLPLPAGSKLVVDCGDLAVKSGQTCPAALLQLHERGVSIYRDADLHAKIFVIGGWAYAGSTNASNHSAQQLKEAMLAVNDPKTVAEIRRFIESLCLDRLGPEELKRLAGIYQKPKFVSGMKKKAEAEKETALPALRVVDLVDEMTDKERAYGADDAKTIKLREGFELDFFMWRDGKRNCPRVGELVMRIDHEGGVRETAQGPGHVVKVTKTTDSDGLGEWYVHVEDEPYCVCEFKELPKSLRQLLWAEGLKDQTQTAQILTQWRQLENEDD